MFSPAGLADKNFGLPLTEVTIADRLKAAGYTTGMFGKWHLGYRKEFNPLNRGFGEFFGFLGGAHTYVNAQVAGDNPVMRGFEPYDEKEYLTDAFTREAVAYINHHAKEAKPFYLYLPYNAVHTPLDTIPKYLERFSNITDPRRRAHAAMLAAMDDGVGAVLDAVRKNGLEERTLVFFFSDNGGPTQSNTSSNKPLRGYKGQVLEGGIRTPSMVSWKGHLPAGKTYDQPVIQLDIMPTAVAAAGGSMPSDRPIDGVDLMPYLTGKKTEAPHETLFWRYGTQAAVRRGDWKLIRIEGGKGGSAVEDEGNAVAKGAKRAARKTEKAAAAAKGADTIGTAGTVRLYDLTKDIHEDNDLSGSQPEKVKELTAALDKWESQLIKPLWRGRSEVLKGAKTQPAEGKGKGKAGKERGKRNK